MRSPFTSIEPLASELAASSCVSGGTPVAAAFVLIRPARTAPYSDCRRMLASRSEEHTSELQSLMRISYAVFCLKKKNNNNERRNYIHINQIRYPHRDRKHIEE